MKQYSPNIFPGAAVAEWLSSWLAEQEDRGSIPGFATWIFRDLLSPASKSRYGWKIAKSTVILKTTNQPNILLQFIYQIQHGETNLNVFYRVWHCVREEKLSKLYALSNES